MQARAELPAVLDPIATVTLDPAAVVDRVLGWEDAVAAFARGRGEARSLCDVLR
jgi:hypothetical protein